MLKIRHIAPPSPGKLITATNCLYFLAMTGGFWVCLSGALFWRGPLESAVGGCASGGPAVSFDSNCGAAGGEAQSDDKKTSGSSSFESEGQMKTLN